MQYHNGGKNKDLQSQGSIVFFKGAGWPVARLESGAVHGKER